VGFRHGLFTRYFDLKEGLERIFGRFVDVVTEESIKILILRLVSNEAERTSMQPEAKKSLLSD